MRKYAVWMSDSDALTRVYPAQTRAQIAALVSELPRDIRGRTLRRGARIFSAQR